MRTAVALALLLLAGCAGPAEPPAPVPAETPEPSRPQEYALTLRVSEETPDGPPLAGVEVEAYPLDRAGQPLPGAAVGRTSGADGTVRFAFREPARLAVRASAAGWTREGAIVEVGPEVTSSGVLVSDRDAFLPLYRSSLVLAASSSLMTSTVEPDPDGPLRSPATLADLALPDAARAGYLARLSGADVAVRWDETPTQRADLAAGLAWDGEVWFQGEPSGFSPVPGTREATWSGELGAQGERLSAAAILHTAAVGDVPLAFEATLRFSGFEPAGLPAPCHSMAACFPLPLPPLPPA